MTKKIVNAIGYIGLFLMTAMSLFPFYVMICMSSHTTNEISRGIVYTLGTALWENIKTLTETNYIRYYANSLYIAVLSMVLSILVSCLCGYGLAIYEFRMPKAMFSVIMATMMIPAQVSMIGFILEMRKMGLSNTHIPLIFYSVAWPFGVFWIRQFVQQSIPIDCLECARIDGCGEWKIFFQIGMPFLKPAISSLAMIAFLNSWNAFLVPQVLLNSDELYTLQIGIRAIGNSHVRDIAAQIAGLSLGVVPILIVFIFGSKYFVSGLTDGAVKG